MVQIRERAAKVSTKRRISARRRLQGKLATRLTRDETRLDWAGLAGSVLKGDWTSRWASRARFCSEPSAVDRGVLGTGYW